MKWSILAEKMLEINVLSREKQRKELEMHVLRNKKIENNEELKKSENTPKNIDIFAFNLNLNLEKA